MVSSFFSWVYVRNTNLENVPIKLKLRNKTSVEKCKNKTLHKNIIYVDAALMLADYHMI